MYKLLIFVTHWRFEVADYDYDYNLTRAAYLETHGMADVTQHIRRSPQIQ